VTFGERRKRKGFGNFVVEARVDEWCSSFQKMEVKRSIYRGKENGLDGGDGLEMILRLITKILS
jgi:hypothetical protein